MRAHSIEGEKLLEGFRLMAEILRGLEWSGWDERFRAHMCPVCGGYKSKNKHFPDCDLNRALSARFDLPTMLAPLDVIERLRRERRTLENAARLLGPLAEHAAKLEAEVDPLDVYEYGSSQIVSEAQDAYNEAYDLLHDEKGGGGRE